MWLLNCQSGLKIPSSALLIWEMKAIVWKDESLGAEFEYREIPDDMKDQAELYHAQMVETAVEGVGC